jgi:hypothetical protein
MPEQITPNVEAVRARVRNQVGAFADAMQNWTLEYQRAASELATADTYEAIARAARQLMIPPPTMRDLPTFNALIDLSTVNIPHMREIE